MIELPLLTRTLLVARAQMAVQFYFAHWHDVTPDFNLDSEIADLMRMALETPDRHKFALGMMRFISKLNNTHCWYRDRWLMETHLQPHIFRLRANDDTTWTVTESFVDALNPGDTLTHIADKSCAAWYEEVRPYINASGERVARILFPAFLRYFLPQAVTVTLTDGTTRPINHDDVQPTPTINDLHTTGEWLVDGQIAKITIPSFNEDRFEDGALDYLAQFRAATCIIFDLRQCVGGNTPYKLTQALMDRPYRKWMEATPIHISLLHYRYQERVMGYEHANTADDSRTGYYNAMEQHFRHPMFMWDAPIITPVPDAYTGKIILLTSSRVGSAGEDFVIPFKTSGRATLIGEQTFGSTGQPYHYRTEDGIWLSIGTKRAYFPDGTRYEGIGITPDIHVQPSIDDLRNGRDVVLERALEIAQG